jgi:hypothetical protein
MMGTERLPPGLTPPEVVILAGPFGSGKTEVAINLAIRWADLCPTYLADLDVVTPYFRSRDARAALAEAGVRVLSPAGDAAVYDVPVFAADVGEVLSDTAAGLVIDVGGQPHGAGVLIHWREALRARNANLCLVVNPRRPGADSAEAAAQLAVELADAAGLALSGIIANGNLGPQTSAADVAIGVAQAAELEKLLGVPTLMVCCPQHLVEEAGRAVRGLPVMDLRLYMRPVWEPPTADQSKRTLS